MIDNARLSASAKNNQSLKYIISNDEATNTLIFPSLIWAGYLQNWKGPEEGERPSAYIVMLNDNSIAQNYFCDDGIATQSILLTAVEKGYGGCIIASLYHNIIRDVLKIDESYKIIQIIALGKPLEEVVIEPLGESGDIKYWRDSNHVHHVPKRNLSDIIIKSYF
jgi:nitroreductase